MTDLEIALSLASIVLGIAALHYASKAHKLASTVHGLKRRDEFSKVLALIEPIISIETAQIGNASMKYNTIIREGTLSHSIVTQINALCIKYKIDDNEFNKAGSSAIANLSWNQLEANDLLGKARNLKKSWKKQ